MNILARRQLLKLKAITGGSLSLRIGLQQRSYARDAGSSRTPFTLPFKLPPVLQPIQSDNTPGTGSNGDTGTDYYQIVQKPGYQQIIPGFTSEWGYNSSFPGSTIWQSKRQQSLIRQINHLPGDNPTCPKIEVANRKYRFRVLNGSISRFYRLALSTGEPFTMIGTDAGLLNSAVNVK